MSDWRDNRGEGSSVRSFWGFTPVTAEGGGLSLSEEWLNSYDSRWTTKETLGPVLPFRLGGAVGDSPQRPFTHTEGASLPKTFYVSLHIWSLRNELIITEKHT